MGLIISRLWARVLDHGALSTGNSGLQGRSIDFFVAVQPSGPFLPLTLCQRDFISLLFSDRFLAFVSGPKAAA